MSLLEKNSYPYSVELAISSSPDSLCDPKPSETLFETSYFFLGSVP